MKRFALFFAFLVFVGLPMLQAQTVQITGKVTSSEDGNAVPGVSVIVKGTTIGTTTDFDGKYSLNVPSGATTLVYSFVGLKSQEVAIGGRNNIDLVLESDVVGLDEVVVTALGISRAKKSLGYSTQEVEGESVAMVKTANFMNSLSGKVSGVQIKKNTNMGGSTNVVVRGNKSLTNTNQILYVVDGMPINNSIGSYLRQNEGQGGYDYGNAASDINPDDIESVNILKGSAATALYGSRGNGGVILITTKKGNKGEKGLGVSVSGNVTVSSMDKSTFAKYQKSYGAGYGAYYDTEDGYFYSLDANGDGTKDDVVPYTEDASFGAAFDASRQVYGWYSFDPQSPWYQKSKPWVAAKNDPSTFFETGVSYTTSIAVENTGDKGSYRMSYTNNNSTGIMPNSHLNKDNFLVNGTWKVSDKLTASASANIIKTKAKGRNSTGYNDNLVGGFRQWWETNVDIKEQKEVWDLTHRNITWNYNADRNAPIYWDNPYWTRYKNYETDGRTRTIGYMSLDYKLTSWLDVLGRAAIDTYFGTQDERRAVGSVAAPFGISRNDQPSGYLRRENNFGEYNFDLMLNFNKNLTEDLNLSGLVGISERRTNESTYTASTEGGLAVADVYSLNNSAGTPPYPTEVASKVGVRSYYGSASLGFRNFLYLDGTYRYDYASTLPVNKNKYSYPSITGSFLFADLLEQNWLSFGKVRLNWAKVGNLAPFNSLTDEYVVESPMNGAAYRLPTTKNNPDLKSESTYSYEAGLEMKFFKNRLGFDLSLYQQNSKDQIMPVTLSQTTGYQYMYVNAGEIKNIGIELALNGTPFQTPAFRWDITVNFAKNKNEVVSLYPGIENLQIGSYNGGVTVNAAKGEAYGALKGTDYTYSSDGQIVINASTGKPVKNTNQIIGNVNPDWTGGIQNTFSYKNLSLGFLIDVQHGGDIFSLDMYYGLSSGLYPETVYTNDLGNPVRNSLATGGGYVIKGVNVSADGTVTPNTTRVAANTYSGFGYGALPNKAFVYDASYIKLREVSISYNLPSKLLSKTFIKGISLSAVGSNLWIIHKNLPYADPESGLAAGNAQGYSIGSLPSTRDFGFNVKFNF